MGSTLRKILKSNDTIADIFRYFYIPITTFNRAKFNFEAYSRKKFTNNKSDYSELKKLKNVHENKRCFIVATGPSLLVEDLEKLKSEITFSMNSIYLSYTETSWRPTYYGIQDPLVYEKIQHEIKDEDFEKAFIGSNVAKEFLLNNTNTRYIFPLDLLNHQLPKSKANTKISEDIFERVYSGYNIAFTMIQIAIYMGFKEIYLVGADCDYQQSKKYFMKDNNRGEEKYFTKRFLANNSDRFIYAYSIAKEYADRNEIKIYNATRGGKLEVFERVDLDNVL